MKKVLYLSLVASSIFSMQLDRVKKDHLPEMISPAKRHNVWKEQIKPPSVFIPARLGDITLYHGDKGFIVYENDKKHKIDKCFMDPVIRNINREDLTTLLQSGYLVINRTVDGAYSLKANVRTVGGGPVFGKIMYWVTKSACYAVLAAGVGVVVICGGGTIGSVSSKESGPAEVADAGVQASLAGTTLYVGAESTVTQAGSAAIFSPGVVAATSIGTGAAASMIVQAGGGPACAKAAGAAVATGSSGTGIVAGIEAISIAVGVLCGLTLTP